MKIVRGKKTYELTSEELFRAYLEQEALFDVETIENNMESYLEKAEVAQLKQNNEFIKCAAAKMRHLLDNYDVDFAYAIKEALEKTKNKFMAERTVKNSGNQ